MNKIKSLSTCLRARMNLPGSTSRIPGAQVCAVDCTWGEFREKFEEILSKLEQNGYIESIELLSDECIHIHFVEHIFGEYSSMIASKKVFDSNGAAFAVYGGLISGY